MRLLFAGVMLSMLMGSGCKRTPEEEQRATDWYYAQRKVDAGKVKSVEIVTDAAHGGSRYSGPFIERRVHVHFEDGSLGVYQLDHHLGEIKPGAFVEILFEKSNLAISKVTVKE